MRLSLLTLLLFVLAVAADDDAYTACKCVRRRLHNRPCHPFIAVGVPTCDPSADWKACEQMCCEACRVYGDDWKVCRSGLLRKLCKGDFEHDDEEHEFEDDDTHERSEEHIGPMVSMEAKSDPITEELEIYPSPDMDAAYYETMSTPRPEDEMVETPEATAEVTAEATVEATSGPLEEVDPTPVAAGIVEAPVPFDGVSEGGLDLSPAHGRPFAPAACECMIAGESCDSVLAAASGVCKPYVHGLSQPTDCHFACCRICIVNMYATYCDNDVIRGVCGV